MKFIILGCGSSMGVPRPDGFYGKDLKVSCKSKEFLKVIIPLAEK